jgi:hypothetical protein
MKNVFEALAAVQTAIFKKDHSIQNAGGIKELNEGWGSMSSRLPKKWSMPFQKIPDGSTQDRYVI